MRRILHRVQERFTVGKNWLKIPLNAFRTAVIIFIIDFLAFLSLSQTSFFSLINPLAFMSANPADKRVTLALYFPRSVSKSHALVSYQLTKEEEIVEKNQTRKDSLETQTPEEKILAAENLRDETTLVEKLALPLSAHGTVLEQGKRIVRELLAGPGDGVEALKARNLIKDPYFLRDVWLYDNQLFISTRKETWQQMSARESTIIEYCLVESLKQNLAGQLFSITRE